MKKSIQTNNKKKKNNRNNINNNKSKKSNNKKTNHDLNSSPEWWISQAEEAMQSLDVSKACEYYQQAVSLLLLQQAQQEENEMETTSTTSSSLKSLLASTLTQLAECKVSLGDVDGAREDFEQALEFTLQEKQYEEKNHGNPLRAALYLSIGQLCLADEARLAYEQGILEYETLVRHDNNTTRDILPNEEQQREDWKSSLARAHCAIAELYLTDLCDVDTAEQQCEYHVQSAMKVCDPPILDALQVLTSLRLSQRNSTSLQDMTNPTTYIWTVYQHMKQGCEALSALVGLHNSEAMLLSSTDNDDEDDIESSEDAAKELIELEAVEQLPSFEFRCQTSKLLLECAVWAEESIHIPCVHAAIQVLGSLLAEQDEVIEIWYLVGCAFELLTRSLLSSSSTSSSTTTIHELSDLSKYYWQRALEMLEKVQEQLGIEMENMDEDDDEDEDDQYRDELLQQLNQCECQMEEIRHKLESIDESVDEEKEDNKTDMPDDVMDVE